MKKIEIISATPELLKSPFSGSIMKRAIEKGIVEIKFHDLKDYSVNNKKQIDDYQFGGGSGMVLMIEPIKKCIDELKKQNDYDEVIFMTPDAPILSQKVSNELSIKGNLIILCGHYKGIDHRVREFLVTKEISVGDYVVSGGELPAAVLCDSIIRLLPGIIGDESSALSDTFQDDLLSPPIYTRPEIYKGLSVPKVLLSGNDKEIQKWNDEKSLERTRLLRPNLFDNE